jgi:prepilin-type N-terminal cleavage/methylation domain-containing protein
MRMNRQAGFTLPEIIVALTLSSVLIGIIIGFMVNSLSQYGIANARAELLNEAQIALDIAANDIRLSANADANNRWLDDNAPGGPDDTLSWESNGNTLVLATAAEDGDGNILFLTLPITSHIKIIVSTSSKTARSTSACWLRRMYLATLRSQRAQKTLPHRPAQRIDYCSETLRALR